MLLRRFIVFIFSLLLCFLLTSCKTTSYDYSGNGNNWNVKLSVQTDSIVYVIRYIGNEPYIKNFQYNFKNPTFDPSGGDDQEQKSTNFEIKHKVVSSNKKLDAPIEINISWNDKEELIMIK